jgi:hypothetical protein
MAIAKMVIAKMPAASVVVHGPPLAERLPAVMVVAQERAALAALEPPAHAPERSD